MKKFSITQKNILAKLADGTWHSDTLLSNQLGISRTDVCEQINQLINLGVQIIINEVLGFQLTQATAFLSKHSIQHYLSNESNHYQFHIFSSLSSTNDYLKSLSIGDIIQVCCAEHQTAGRGRFGRKWHSPFAENLYCSIGMKLQCDLADLSGLSLVIGLAIIQTLTHFDIDAPIQIKWPNDLIWQRKKLGGILIEINGEHHGANHLIIGIGLNVNGKNTLNYPIENPRCSLYEMTGKSIDRNQLIATLLITLKQHLNLFFQQGFLPFIEQWSTVDALNQQSVQLTHAGKTIVGTAKGINEKGQLLLVDQANHLHVISSGEATFA